MSPAEPLWLSRARLRRDVPAAALRALLVCDDDSARVAAAHRLVWTLFADDPGRTRDFLWREAEPGLFYLLSARPPADAHGLFELDAPRPFAPALSPGDRLAFTLRVNATVARRPADAPKGAQVRGVRSDVVMDALRAVPTAERAVARRQLLDDVAAQWLEAQGASHGFALAPVDDDPRWDGDPVDDPARVAPSAVARPNLRVTGYRVLRIARGGSRKRLQLGMLDVDGVLTVREPGVFLAALRAGFGRGKAFGCGLMLVRRAP